MKHSVIPLLFAAFLMFTACKPAPEKCFSFATLNCNLMFGFAGTGMQRELESPSVKLMNETTYETAPMNRAEVVDGKLDIVQQNYNKVKGLSMDDDSKEMITASLALYEFVIPVYKNEYRELARLYDNGASAENILAMEATIRDKYAEKFETLYNAVVTHGTAFAQRNGIRVAQVNTSPPGAR